MENNKNYSLNNEINKDKEKTTTENSIDVLPMYINFYGCSFNFANDSNAESRYYMGDDIYENKSTDWNY